MSGGGSIFETTGNQGQMASALAQGLDVVDLNQTVLFTQYRRVVLPADGFVFWCKADILSPSALLNTSTLNSFGFNQAPQVTSLAPTITATGSLHFTTVNRQESDESYSVNRLVFTSLSEVNDLNEIAPNIMYLATVAGERYAFSSRSMWYKQAGLRHYSGDAVYAALASQVIDNPAQLNQTDNVISNSLPLWLTLNQFFPVYPSMLVPDNLPPPYASVHIGEDDTTPLQAGAWHDQTGSRWQLCKDVVTVTTYGVRNNEIMDWLDYVKEFTLNNPTVMGLMNSPVPRDAKRGQVEISALAQKKVVTFEADYYQQRIRALSRQYIKSAFIEDLLLPTEVELA